MTTGTGIALAVGGAALVGGALYLLTRQPVPVATRTINGVPAAGAPTVGTGILSLIGGLGSGVGSGLVNLFGGSKSTPTVAAISNSPIQPAQVTPAQNLTNLQNQGWTGLASPTASETSLGIGPEDYY